MSYWPRSYLPYWSLSAVLLLGACSETAPLTHEPIQPQVSPKRVEARQVDLSHVVLFDTDKGELTTGEKIALENFARSLSPTEVMGGVRYWPCR